MNLTIIEQTIFDLENASLNSENVQELAHLYIIRNNFKKNEENIIEEAIDRVTAELKDILPQYRRYKEVRRQCALKQVNQDAVSECLQCVCVELQDFIQALYTNTECEEERNQIKRTLNELNKKFK